MNTTRISCAAECAKTVGSDGRGVGFYFRNTTELNPLGIRGKSNRTLALGRSQVNILRTQKAEHSRKPVAAYEPIERCSPGPHLELFARGSREGWSAWGNQSESYEPDWSTVARRATRRAVDGTPQIALL